MLELNKLYTTVDQILRNVVLSFRKIDFKKINCDSISKGDAYHKKQRNITIPWNMDHQMIGGISGGSVTLVLGVGSIFSKQLRCGMMLIVPSLFSGRGRSLMLTFASGMLIEGRFVMLTYISN